MSLVKFRGLSSAIVFGVLFVQSAFAEACDPPTRQVSIERSPSPVDDLISQLETFVVPVSERVSICNAELVQAQAAVDTLNGKMAAAVAEQAKSLRILKMLKQALEQPGCTVKLDDQAYDRETVGAAIEVKLATYRAQSCRVNSLTKDLVLAQKNLEKVAAKVARWVAKEQELVAQIELLETLVNEASKEVASVQNQTNVLAKSLHYMLRGDGSVSQANSRQLSKSQAELVAEVDQVLTSR